VIDKHKLLAFLQGHIGAASGVSAATLAQLFHITPRHVRELVTELRLEGVAVCGRPKTGYFIAATGEEIEATCQFLRSRAMHSLTLESALRETTLGELLGQMRLKT